uniref:Aminotransferase class V domain-containing protein n=1 Tax=Rhizochromulina marina TaxID=1034831 RepID=A0A7S2W2G7_9STRA
MGQADHEVLEKSVRENFARLLETSSENVAITPSTSYAITMAAKNLGLQSPRNCALVLENQMASNVLPWQHCTQEAGGEVLVVPRPDGGDWDWASAIISRLEGPVGGRIGVVALPHVHWSDGSWVDLERVGPACARLGIPLVCDITQSAGALPFSVPKIRPAFACASVHKWLLGPYGFSLLYVDPNWQTRSLPLDHHERRRVGAAHPLWDVVGAMTYSVPEDAAGASCCGVGGYPMELVPGAARLDAGGRCNPVGLPMLAPALAAVTEWGPAAVQAAVAKKVAVIQQAASQLGLVSPPNARHFVGLYFPSTFTGGSPSERQARKSAFWDQTLGQTSGNGPSAAATAGASPIVTPPEEGERRMFVVFRYLKKQGILCQLRNGCLRVAPYLFTTDQDLELFVTALGNAVQLALSDVPE